MPSASTKKSAARIAVVRAFGETALLVPDVPDDGRNRRVEISTLN